MVEKRDLARELARQHYEAGDPLGWFESLYSTAAGDFDAIPWADQAVNPLLDAWCRREVLPRPGARVLVVGCGLGDDAEYLAANGAAVTAIDISEAAISWCRQRFPHSPVRYEVANLLTYSGAFDFIVEIYTLQAMPAELRAQAIGALARLGCEILIICRGRDESDHPGQLPWPLTRAELQPIETAGFETVQFEDFDDPFEPGKRRFRAHFRREP